MATSDRSSRDGRLSRVDVTRVDIGVGSLFMILAAVVVGIVAFDVATSARRTLGWAVAAVVVAGLIDPLVSFLDRHIPRVLAVLVSFLAVGAGVGAAMAGVLHGLGTQVDRLQDEAPRAAARIETRSRFRDIAQRMDLTTRVREVVDRLDDPTSGVVGRAASSVSGYLVGAVLCIFLLSWGPRLVNGALGQLPPSRRARVSLVGTLAFRRARRYVLSSLGLATVSGALVGMLCWGLDVPGPSALGVAVAACSVIPGIGVVIGALPALLIEGGLGSANGTMLLGLAVLVVQIVHTMTLRRLVVPRSLIVGPAAVTVALVLGFGIYGLGGAYFAAALAVFVVAVIDATGEPGEPWPMYAADRSPAGPVMPANESIDRDAPSPQGEE